MNSWWNHCKNWVEHIKIVIENKFVNMDMKGKLICLQIILVLMYLYYFMLQLGLGEY